MLTCINKNSIEYQSLKNRAGISEFMLDSICRNFLDKYGRFPHLDELPDSNSEQSLRNSLQIKLNNGAKISKILEVTGTDNIEEATISINDLYRDLETTIIPIDKEAIVDIVHRPTDNNFDDWTEKDEILATAPRDKDGNLLAPNGRISNLTEKLYVLVRTKNFINWFGDWQQVNNFNIDTIDTSKVDIEEVIKPWRTDNSKSNKTIRIYIKNQHNKGYFELVKDQEFGIYSVHFKTGNADTGEIYGSTKEERTILYEQILNALPDGAQLSTWGELSEGGIKALNKFGKTLKKVGERTVKDRKGNIINIPIYQKGNGVSKVVDENGEPLVVYHGNRTDNKITIFDKSKKGTEHKERAISGFWFITNKNIAKDEYAIKSESIGRGIEYLQYGEILSVFLNIKNPIIKEQQGIRVDSTLYGTFTYTEEKLDDFINRVKNSEKENTDGYILTMVDSDNNADDYNSKQTQIVVFNPNQIKSAESNTGVFSKLNDNIYDTVPNSYLILSNALNKLASLYGINFNEVSEAELNTELWNNLIPDASSVNAFVYNGQIYINTDRADIDAPIHEMFHILVGSMRFDNPSLYESLIKTVENLSNYSALAYNYLGRSRNDINEEIFITELSRYFSGLPSQLSNLDEKSMYELTYNIKRTLDTILMGHDSVKTISDDRLYNMSLKDIIEEVNSSIATSNFKGFINVEGSELHRKLNNIKSDLLKNESLKEYCE